MNEQVIEQNWQVLMDIVDKYFEGEQKENIMKLYSDFEDECKLAPASGKPNFHNCFKGGYLEHVLHVINNSLDVKRLYEKNGTDVIHSDSDVVLAAMFHDLGKLGDGTESYYVYQTNDWRRNNLNEWYTRNDKLEFMNVGDRGLWLLSKYGVQLNEHVYKAIICADGLFDAAAEKYFKAYVDSRHILSNIIHMGDWISTIAEKQMWVQKEESGESEFVDIKAPKTKKERETVDNMKSKFDELFA